MAEKLLLFLTTKNLNLRLASRAVFFWLGALLFLPGGILRTTLFVLLTLFLYNPLDGVRAFAYVVILDALAIIAFSSVTYGAGIVIAAVSALIFFFIMGMKQVAFHHLSEITSIVFFALAYGLFLSVLSHTIGMISFLVFFALLVFSFLRTAVPERIGERIIAGWLIIALCAELIVVARIIPIGAPNLSLMLLILLFMTSDYIVHVFGERMTRQRLLLDAIVGSALFLFLFLTSRWMPF